MPHKTQVEKRDLMSQRLRRWPRLAAIGVIAVALALLGRGMWLNSRAGKEALDARPSQTTFVALTNFPQVPPTFDDGAPRQAPEFQVIAQRLHAQGSPRFFSRRMIGGLEELLWQPDLAAERRIDYTGHLAQLLLNEGRVDEAAERIETVADLSAKAGQQLSVEFHRLRAIIHLRQAEVQNCIIRHNAECCVFPLQGGGVHSQPQSAEHAK